MSGLSGIPKPNLLGMTLVTKASQYYLVLFLMLVILAVASMLLGNVAGCDFYIGAAQFEYWQHTQLIIDVVPGRGSGFSAEAPEGVRFLTRSRVFTDAEVEELEAAGPPARAA